MKRVRFTSALLLAMAGSLTAGAALAASELADLIQNGRRQEALALIDAGVDVDAAQGDDTTALHWAVYKLDVPLVQRLLESGANAAAANRYGSTPLSEAVKAAHAGLVEMLLEAGADPESPNGDGQTALMLAARAGSLDIARLLVEHGAAVDAREAWRGQTALMWAAEGRFAALVRFLIDQGADVGVRGLVNDWGAQITSEPRAQYRPTGGLTALLYAARSGCIDCIDAILAAGEDIDRPTPDGVTALMLAIDNFEFDAAVHLLDAGANPHYADWWGRTALYIAVDMNTYVPRTLLGGLGGEDTTPGATLSSQTSGLDIVQRLLAAGVAVDTQLNMHRVGRGGNSQRFTDDLLTTGATPLLRAAITHDHDSMRLLLEHGAHVDLPNVMGVTPLMAAAGIGVRDINFGSNRSPRFDSDPLIEARVIESLEMLLAAGADINARVTDLHSRTARIARINQMTDREGQTALFSPAGRGWMRVTQFMIEHGAEVDVVDKLGRSPLDAALGRLASGAAAHEAVAELLAAAAR
jgi:serine/threonine-protein phosphatase 6 regulatory ankyrin repeat subunit B